jgi:hypothetical protein
LLGQLINLVSVLPLGSTKRTSRVVPRQSSGQSCAIYLPAREVSLTCSCCSLALGSGFGAADLPRGGRNTHGLFPHTFFGRRTCHEAIRTCCVRLFGTSCLPCPCLCSLTVCRLLVRFSDTVRRVCRVLALVHPFLRLYRLCGSRHGGTHLYEALALPCGARDLHLGANSIDHAL